MCSACSPGRMPATFASRSSRSKALRAQLTLIAARRFASAGNISPRAMPSPPETLRAVRAGKTHADSISLCGGVPRVCADRRCEVSTPAYSPGLEGVIAGETAICTVEGGLSYRGYAVGDLAEHCTFEEVAHLLLHGELPTPAQLAAFQSRVAAARRLPPPLKDLLGALPKWTTPLDALRTAVSALGHFDHDAADNSHDANRRKAERLIAQIPVAVADHYRLAKRLQPVLARHDLGQAANFLFMLRDAEPAPEEVKALDVSLIL